MLVIVIGAAFFYFIKIPHGQKIAPAINTGLSSQNMDLSGSKVKHVLIIVEENQKYENVIGNTRDMPYLNMLAKKYAYSKNYYADTHPSMGNYFVLTTGKIISNKDSYSATVSDDNIVRQLINSRKTWKEYSEDIPQAGYTGNDSGGYTEHHNPLSYFSDVRENENQRQNLVPFSQLATDIKNDQLPEFSFIVPSERNDAHDCPSGGSCTNSQKLAAADQWLKTNIDPLLNSPHFADSGDSILVITFDEGNKTDRTSGGGHTVWIVAGPAIRKGYSSDTFYQHENTLRFISELLGLSDFPGKSAQSSDMHEFLLNP